MTKTEHTPTPWQLAPSKSKAQYSGFTADMECIFNAVDRTDGGLSVRHANAAFIVRAVNSHAALVEALGALIDGVMNYMDGDGEEAKLKEAVRVACVARKLAKGA